MNEQNTTLSAMLDAATAAVVQMQSGSNDGCIATRSLVEAALEAAGVAALIRERDGFRDTVNAQHIALEALHRRIAELEAALRPFAQMDRAGCDLSEIACERGVASDLTIITSGDFRRASDVLNAPTGAGGE